MTDPDQLLPGQPAEPQAEMAKEPEFNPPPAKTPELLPEPREERLQEPSAGQRPPQSEFHDDTTGPKKTRKVIQSLRDTRWRFVFLGLCCFVLMGSYFCYDNPAPVEDKIKTVMADGSE